MAIYFNDGKKYKILKPNENGDEMEQRYARELKEISGMFKNGSIILHRPGVKRQWDSEKISTRPIAAMAIPDETPFYSDNLGSVTVRYAEHPPQLDGNRPKFTLARLLIEERLNIPESKKDLAWYIIKATNFVENGILQINDPQREIIGKASAVKRIAKVDGLLLNEDSPIYNKEALTFLADKFGIDAPSKYDTEAIAYLIREAVLSADKVANHPTLNIDKFLAAASKLAKVEKKDEKFELKDSYSQEELKGLHQKELNSISKELGLPKPPHCTKVIQIEKILEQQAQPVE